MGIVMQLLIETCEFPNNTSPRELLARKGTNAQYSIPAGPVCQLRREVFYRLADGGPVLLNW
jgi:hypothetical protein